MAIRPVRTKRIVHKAAWLLLCARPGQDQVAQQLNISRASVAMYLRKARETGIVNISTSTQLFTDDVMAARDSRTPLASTRSGWRPRMATIRSDGGQSAGTRRGASSSNWSGSGDRIGVARGPTVYTIADLMAYADLQGVTVVQLCGNLGAPYSYRPDRVHDGDRAAASTPRA